MSPRTCFRNKKSYDYFSTGHVHACIVVVLKRPELQKTKLKGTWISQVFRSVNINEAIRSFSCYGKS